MEGTKSEDILIFNGLTPQITNMAPIYEAFENFCNKKQSIDASDRFNLILFEDRGPNYFEDFTLNSELVILALKTMEPMLVRANVGGGIMTAITFIIEVFKKIPEKCYRLIILLDKGSRKIPEEHILVLENLIDKVVYMPFYIDAILIQIDDSEEIEKITKLVEQTDGKFYNIESSAEIDDVLDGLTKKKDFYLSSKLDEKELGIPEEKRLFFENLADDPPEVQGEQTCEVCFKKDIEGIVKCSKCETLVHKKCWSLWAKNSHIGLKNVFRCHKCYNLMKFNKNYVEAIQSGKELIEEEIQIEKVNLLQYLETIESKEGPQIIKAEDSLPVEVESEEDDDFFSEYLKMRDEIRSSRDKENKKFF